MYWIVEWLINSFWTYLAFAFLASFIAYRRRMRGE